MQANNAETVSICIDHLCAVRCLFTERFYQRLLEELPETEAMFIHDPKRQEMMLFAAMSMMLKGLETGRDLRAEMFEFGRIHRRVGVREEMFPVFGAVFLEMLIEFLPEDDHPGLATAWWGVYTEIYETIVQGMRADAADKAAARRLFSGPDFSGPDFSGPNVIDIGMAS